MTTTFPDITRILPAGRLLVPRVLEINEAIRAAAADHDFRLVDLYYAESMTDPGVWSPDRVHGSRSGHLLFAAAAAEALGLPGSNHDWALAGAGVAEHQAFRSRMYSQLLWTQNMFMPWIWRHLRGRGAGHGRGPRHPELASVSARSEAQ